MVNKTGPVACGQEPKTGRCVKNTFKMTRSKDIQLQHLPPDVLHCILSRLTMKEAVRMSILSKKWSRLWKCYPKLVFTRATMRSSDAMVGHRKPLRTRFIRGINSILRQLKSANLDKFVVKFALRKRHTPHIDRWINFSAASRTKHVVLDLRPGRKGSTDTDDKYSFPLHFFNASSGSCVRSLRLGFVYLTLPPAQCFANLKKLSLYMVDITGELHCLLPKCTALEWLSIIRCRLQVGLSIRHELSRLHYLCLQYCSLQNLDIQAPNITTFVFGDKIIPIMLDKTLKVSEATISLLSSSDCFNYVFTDLVNALSHVQYLSINFRIETEVMGFLKNPTRLSNLRHLVLKIDIVGCSQTSGGILRLASLLELAPVLEELVLHMCCFNLATCDPEPCEDAYRPHPHGHLKTVQMTGFYGIQGQLDLALYLLQNATSLDRMIIDPTVRNNSYVPPLKGEQANIRTGRAIAINKLCRKEFRGVLAVV